jgi:hypothetical protein
VAMRQEFNKSVRPDEFKLERLVTTKSCKDFYCSIAEYNDYIVNDATRSIKKNKLNEKLQWRNIDNPITRHKKWNHTEYLIQY